MVLKLAGQEELQAWQAGEHLKVKVRASTLQDEEGCTRCCFAITNETKLNKKGGGVQKNFSF